MEDGCFSEGVWKQGDQQGGSWGDWEEAVPQAGVVAGGGWGRRGMKASKVGHRGTAVFLPGSRPGGDSLGRSSVLDMLLLRGLGDLQAEESLRREGSRGVAESRRQDLD